MTMATTASPVLHFLEDRWDPTVAAGLDEPELLRYRSNLLGSDLRITNFAGGNTSSKVVELDPLTGNPVEVLWVKGSGGDLGSIKRAGFATLYQEKLLALERIYKGVDSEDQMAEMYPLCAFRNNPVAASIDTPLHGFLPFPHVDHLHPDWGIALAASANGKSKMEEFNREFGHSLVWLPWQRPGFELAMMMKRIVQENPGCDGIVLGGHGLFTWGQTQRECYLNTLHMIDEHRAVHRASRKSEGQSALWRRGCTGARGPQRELAIQIAPFLRGRISARQRFISSFSDAPDVMQFVDSAHGKAAGVPGDQLSRTTLSAPRSGRMFVPWGAGEGIEALKKQIDCSLARVSRPVSRILSHVCHAGVACDSRCQPAVVLIPGLGMFSFGKEQDRGAHYRRVLYQCDSRDGRREPAGRGRGERDACRSARREWIRRASRCSAIMWRCRRWRRSASSTGRWRRRRFAASRRRRS